MRERTYLSLFSGIGGLDLAAELHGFTCVGQVEWDKSCTSVLERWWPTVRRWGDIAGYPDGAPTNTHAENGRPRSATRERHRGVDLITGGFPCQPASTAGRRKGTADARWLWPEFARVIGELGPRYVLVENVPGLLTVNGGRAFSEILGDLAALGYDATWTSLRAADVGACHRRERIFLLAHADEQSDGSEWWLERPLETSGRDCRSMAPHADGIGHQPLLRPPSLTGLHQGQTGPEPGRAGGRAPADANLGPLTRTGPAGDGLPEPAQRGAFAWGPYAAAIVRWERVLMRPAPHPVDEKGRLSPPFVEWMMGFPEGWTADLSRTQALKALGNAVVPQQGAAALERILQLSATQVSA